MKCPILSYGVDISPALMFRGTQFVQLLWCRLCSALPSCAVYTITLLHRAENNLYSSPNPTLWQASLSTNFWDDLPLLEMQSFHTGKGLDCRFVGFYILCSLPGDYLTFEGICYLLLQLLSSSCTSVCPHKICLLLLVAFWQQKNTFKIYIKTGKSQLRFRPHHLTISSRSWD